MGEYSRANCPSLLDALIAVANELADIKEHIGFAAFDHSKNSYDTGDPILHRIANVLERSLENDDGDNIPDLLKGKEIHPNQSGPWGAESLKKHGMPIDKKATPVEFNVDDYVVDEDDEDDGAKK